MMSPKTNTRRSIKILILLILINMFLLLHSSTTQEGSVHPERPLRLSVSSPTVQSTLSYAPHDPIEVSNDIELAAVAVNGSGKENDPYVLEGWNITAPDSDGISVIGTTAHFMIQNCLVEAGSIGIYIANIASRTVNIFNNSIQNSFIGILLHNSGNTILSSNIIQNNTRGIVLRDSGNSILSNNTFLECGLGFYDFDTSQEIYLSYSIENNWVNGRPLGWFANKKNLTLSTSYGQLFLINCTNVVVKDQNCSNIERGITLYFSSFCQVIDSHFNRNQFEGIYLHHSGNATLHNNSYQNNNAGIFLLYSGNATLHNNSCQNNNNEGIFLWYSGNATLNNNSCAKNGGTGISLQDSGNTTLSKNICSQNLGSGISLYQSGNATLNNNTSINNDGDGIRLDDSSNAILSNNTCSQNLGKGINLVSFENAVLSNNTCSLNHGTGIYLVLSDECSIIWNIVDFNRDYGVYLERSNENIVHHNTFIANGLYYDRPSQAYDDGSNNQWYDSSTLEGNYWSDYTGSGDYEIDGNAETTDPYPLDEFGNPLDEYGFQAIYTLGLLLVVVIHTIHKRSKHLC